MYEYLFLYNLVNRVNCRSLDFCQSVGREIISHCILIFIFLSMIEIEFFLCLNLICFNFFTNHLFMSLPNFLSDCQSFLIPQLYWDIINIMLCKFKMYVMIWHMYILQNVYHSRLVNIFYSHNYHFAAAVVMVRTLKLSSLTYFQVYNAVLLTSAH